MALAHMPPLPPELALDDSPLPDADLEQLWEAATELAADAGLDVGVATLQLADSDDGPSRRWWITDDGAAEWALRHVAEADATLAQLAAQRDAWMERIAQWYRQAADREHARRAFFIDHLGRYAMAEREKGRKTVQLPSGKVGTRAQAARVAVSNPAAVLAWAECAGVLDLVAPPKREVKVTPLRELVRPVEVVDEAELLLATGEVLRWARTGYADAALALPPSAVVGARCPDVGDGHYLRTTEPLYRPDAPEGEPVLVDDVADLPGLVAQVLVLASHPEVWGPDDRPVPGMYVEPEAVQPTVTLAKG